MTETPDAVLDALTAETTTEPEPISEPEPVVEETPEPPAAPTAPAEAVVNPDDAMLDALFSRIAPVAVKATHLKMLVIGDPGSGKTVLAATAPRPLIVDVEKGTASLVGSPVTDRMDEIAVLEYKSFRQLEVLIDQITRNPERFDTFDTLVIDSISELSKRGLEEITEREHRANPSRNRFTAETNDYTENNEHIRRLVSSFRDLPKNLVVISHIREQVDKRTGLTIKRADFSERMAGTLNGIFDVVGLLTYDSETGTRALQVQPTADVVVKTRINGLPPVVENPTWDIFEAAFQAQKNN